MTTRDPQAYQEAKKCVVTAQELLGKAIHLFNAGNWNETADDFLYTYEWLDCYTDPEDGMFYHLERPDPDEGEDA